MFAAAVVPALDATNYFEEFAIRGTINFDVFFGAYFLQTWAARNTWRFTLLDGAPYKQLIWYNRPIVQLLSTNTYTADT